jgi:hypothetical protein
MKIYKYSLGDDPRIKEILTVLMPETARQLRIAYQGSELFIWAEVDPTESFVERKYILLHTGAEVEPNMMYQTTLFEGPFVWHLYRIGYN